MNTNFSKNGPPRPVNITYSGGAYFLGGFDIMLHVALGLSIVHLVLLPGNVKRSTQILHG